MPTILIASLQPGEGRTSTTAALGACLAEEGRAVRLMRVRSTAGADPNAEDDARSLAAVPGCTAPQSAVSEQEAQSQAAEASGALCLIETPPGAPVELAGRLSARVLLVTSSPNSDLTDTALGERLLGMIVTRQTERGLEAARSAIQERGLACLGVLPEDRLLAGPTVREMAEALRASSLMESGEQDEAVEFVMLGPISADPGQPYFLQHGSKAVLNRFDKMDLHLAALATEPDCLILTGGQQPSPYLLDRVAGSDLEITVLLAPEGTVRTMEALDELYGRTRFTGRRKLARAVELVREHVDLGRLNEALR